MKPTQLVIFHLLIISFVHAAHADEWRWRNIAWEGQGLGSVASPPGSANVIYITTFDVPAEEVGVHKSIDGGATWWFLAESNNYDASLLTIDPNDPATVYCGSASWFGPDTWPWRSHDAGAHWERTDESLWKYAPSPWIESVIFATDHPMGGYALFRSTDDGSSWSGLCGAEISDFSSRVLFHREDSLQVFAGYYEMSTGSNGLGRSRDGGYAWEVVLEGNVSTFDQDPVDANHWVAIKSAPSPSGEALFAESFDNGDSWDLWPMPDSIWLVRGMQFDLLDPQTIYLIDPIAYWVEHLGLYRSTDGGHSWASMNEGFFEPAGIGEICQTRGLGRKMLAAGNSGLWLWTDELIGESPGAVLSNTLRIDSVMPCPFRSQVDFLMTLTTSGPVQANVYSLNGELVRRLLHTSFTKGTHRLTWMGEDGSGHDVAPGTYILSLRGGGKESAMRIVKIR